MSSLIIRDICESDIETVVDLWAETGLSKGWHDPGGDIAFSMRSDNSTILVAEKGAALLGTLMVGHDGHWGWMYYFAVDDNWRALGIGKRLMKAGENWLKERGLKKVNLLVLKDNLVVKDYYERIGFKEFPAVCMQKVL